MGVTLYIQGTMYLLAFRKKTFFTIANDADYFARDVPDKELLERIKERRADIFTFIERTWCHVINNKSKSWTKENDNAAILHITTYDDWWDDISRKTRNMVRKAVKKGIETQTLEPSKKLAEGIWEIYNETPIRQGREFPHYGESLESVMQVVFSPRNCIYIGAYYQEELVGFIRLIRGDSTAQLANLLSMQKHWDKAVNNSLMAETVRVCASNGTQWLVYGRMTNHPTLDRFKKNNGFVQLPLTRYYIPLTRRGKIAVAFGLHREMEDLLPDFIKYPIILPLYSWISRTKIKIKLFLNRPPRDGGKVHVRPY